jgi:hypothetical protein
LRDLLDSPVDFLKIDIEGAEYAVLKDCRDRLQNVRNLFVEYHAAPDEPQRLNEMLSWFSEAGFSTIFPKRHSSSLIRSFHGAAMCLRCS